MNEPGAETQGTGFYLAPPTVVGRETIVYRL